MTVDQNLHLLQNLLSGTHPRGRPRMWSTSHYSFIGVLALQLIVIALDLHRSRFLSLSAATPNRSHEMRTYMYVCSVRLTYLSTVFPSHLILSVCREAPCPLNRWLPFLSSAPGGSPRPDVFFTSNMCGCVAVICRSDDHRSHCLPSSLPTNPSPDFLPRPPWPNVFW